MAVLRISPELYKRLEAHAKGFDSPAQVIERILNAYEGIPNSPKKEPSEKPKPVLSFIPNEDEFRLSLVNGCEAKVIIHYQDGSSCNKSWRASRFTDSSNLRGNIWSGFLRGWKDQDITAAEFHVGE
ncbi:hypothetical protein [Candidatus Colwellia aromaticivorans]|uniref:hypothetical protein n=1 Tax=Candidatus Colwellia aromaticivorans TaxID=2267621 RepID=UPI000DF1AEB2|nr:hypothetical protein [Candidatus Colwellia aromaticivorans]